MILIFVILLIISRFLTASETSFFNLRKHDKVSDKVKSLLAKPRELLTFILIGNTLANIAIGSIAASYTINVLSKKYNNVSEENLLFIEVVVVTLVILIFGEIIPKTFAINQSKYFSNLISMPITFLLKVCKPFFLIFYKMSDYVVKVNPLAKEKTFDTEEELIMLTELVEEQGTIKETESNMIQSVFEFDDKLVKEILTPRVDIIAINSTSSLDDAMDLIANEKVSKIPVYKESIDNILGILYAKDIIPYLIGSRPKINLVNLSRDPLFVPETKQINDLLDDFKNKKKNIAIAVDEWGGTSGLVTLEDVVEEIVGEVSDPYDKEEYSFREISDDKYIVEGAIKIYDLEENIEVKFPEVREYDTLAGYIFDAMGDIPKINEKVTFQDYSFKVIELTKNRIDKVEIKKNK